MSPTPSQIGVHPLREVWSIAWPTVLTMTSYTVMQFVDKLMVGQVGPLEVAAMGNGGIWAFIILAIGMGFLTVVNTFVSQNLGAGRQREGAQYAWAGVWIGVCAWLTLLIPYALLVPVVFSHMHDRDVVADVDRLIAMESGYAQILLVGGVLTLCSRALHHYFFGLHRPRIVTVSALCGNCTNVLVNYALIFGAEGLPQYGLPGVPGAPALGVYGAAIGTVVGTSIELAIPAAIFLGPRFDAEMGTRAAWRPRWRPIRDLLRLGWPASIQFGNEIICWSIFMTVLVGRFGADHMAAGWIALGYMHLSFMPAVGFSVAITSVVGKYIGAGDPDTAVARVRLGLGMAVSYMTVCAILFVVFRREAIGAFVGGDATPEMAEAIVTIGARLMICAAVFQTLDAIGIVYSGALRGAGDTVWPGVVTMVLSWGFIVLGGWLLTIWWPSITSIGPWIGASAYIMALGVLMGWRFERGRWRSIRLIDPEHADAARVAPIVQSPPASHAGAAIADLAEETAPPPEE